MLKVHVHESFEGPVRAALLQVLNTLLDDQKVQMVDTLNESAAVIVHGLRPLERVHSYDQRFIVVLELREKAPAKVAENVVITTIPHVVVDTLRFLSDLLPLPVQESAPTSARPGAKCVLVIENSQCHVEAAKKQLSTDYDLTVVTNYQQALKAVQQPYDAVLTDLMLPASSETLGTEAIEKYVGQEMPLGFVLVFLASAAGTKRIGVVTDLNHHAHPVSAALDHLRKPHTINGATVIFANTAMTSDGKDWRQVLESLLKE
jgi:CheY-like chemotaxis protein